MIIGVCGIKRSGSTAQYNMVRLILETQGEVNTTDDTFNFKEGVNLYKTHVFNRAIFTRSNYIFTTSRPEKDIEASLKRFNVGEVKTMSRMKRDLNQWRRKSLHQEFTDIVNNPKMCIKQIANHLRIDVDVEDIFSKFKAIKPEEEYNPKTMLFPNHITK
jgi:hypothetical protein